MPTDAERRFLDSQRVARLATADASGAPHVVPVCFALGRDTAYIAIDRKPKRVAATALKRLRNIGENPRVALVIDRYDEDWSRLAWVMVRGRAEILSDGLEHAEALVLLRARYAQLAAMDLADRPVIAIRIERTTSWGAVG
jgi:PPOX class probable F420-dependent enzyme